MQPPPLGFGNPLGVAGIPTPRMGPCAAGRVLTFPDEEEWARPCPRPPVGVLTVTSVNDDGELEEPMCLPMCGVHRDLMASRGPQDGAAPN